MPAEARLDRATARTARRGHQNGRPLRVERHWSGARVIAWQLSIVCIILIGWEAGARANLIDPFFWSYPSKIAATFNIFVATGSAYTDTWFTLRATILGFVCGTLSGAAIGLSFWWSRN